MIQSVSKTYQAHIRALTMSLTVTLNIDLVTYRDNNTTVKTK